MTEEVPQDPNSRAKRLGLTSRAERLGLTGSGPITPGHSKFAPDELRARADKSVGDATQETMDAQGDLIRTLQAGVGAAELGAQAIPAVARSIPAILRGSVNMAKSVGGNLPAIRDAALSPLNSGARWRTVSRVIEAVKNRANMSGPSLEGVEAPISPVLRGRELPFSRAPRAERPMPDIPHTVDRPIETQGAIQSALEAPRASRLAGSRSRPTPNVDVPQTMERVIETQSPADAMMAGTPRSALERQFQNVVDDGQAGYEATLHKGTPTMDPPDNPELMRRIEESLLRAKAERATPRFRPTGGESSGRSVADVLRAKRGP